MSDKKYIGFERETTPGTPVSMPLWYEEALRNGPTPGVRYWSLRGIWLRLIYRLFHRD